MYWTKQIYKYQDLPETLLVTVTDEASSVWASAQIPVLECPVEVLDDVKGQDWGHDFLKSVQRIVLIEARKRAACAADFFTEVDALLEEGQGNPLPLESAS